MAIISNSGFDGHEHILLQNALGNKLNLGVCESQTSQVSECDHEVEKAEMVLSPWL